MAAMITKYSGRKHPRPSATIMLRAVLLLACASWVTALYQEGDFVHTTKRVQLKGLRTQWHDVIEHYCPRFNYDHTVAIPIHKPKNVLDNGEGITDYRLQLAFDGDRFLTPWVKVLGKSVMQMPIVRVQLRSAGQELLGVKVQVLAMSEEFLVEHASLYEDFRNATHWPKHVLVAYEWQAEPELDLDAGLYLMLAAGLAITLLLSIHNLTGVKSKLAAFMREVVAEKLDPLLGPGLVGDPGTTGASGYLTSSKGGGHVD